MDSITNSQPPSIAWLVTQLFDHLPKPDGTPYTVTEVAQATGIVYNTLRAIIAGKTPNPGIKTIREIAQFFKVPMTYFEVKTEAEASAILKAVQMGLTDTQHLLFRFSQLSPDAQSDILKILTWVERAEQHRLAGGDPDDLLGDGSVQIFLPD